MSRIRKAAHYQGYSPGSRSKSKVTVRQGRHAVDAVMAMFAAAYRAELRELRAVRA